MTAAAEAVAGETAPARSLGQKLPTLADTTDSAKTQGTNLMHELPLTGGGAPCDHDVQCGYYDDRARSNDRRSLPSGNGARCLVGRCICSNRFEDKFGCPRCTTLEKFEYSVSNLRFELTTKIRDDLGRHINLCDLPVGGAKCKVGKCTRDKKTNYTTICDGDVQCDAGGSSSGMCVGPDGGDGTCVCARGYFCTDCTLHELDVRDGARCGKYISGGALCRGQRDCSTHSTCATKDGRSFCHCDR